jgi:coenzyme F420-reducing hydrogenase alpha subunit
MLVRVRDGVVVDTQFRIFEPPRFFEALLRGRMFGEAPDITSRICGICPVAYITSACNAMEQALGAALPQDLVDLRRLAYCGEWIESHVLHAAMLHAPDFLGFDSALVLAKARPELVKKALRLKKLGNDILEVVGGRAIHPVNFKVGGFYQAPTTDAVRQLCDPLRWGIDAAIEIARTFATFDFPDDHEDYLFVSLKDDRAYAIENGRLVSSHGLDVPVDAFEVHVREEQVERSNALHALTDDGRSYLVGPLARYANNFQQLSDLARDTARAVGLGPVCTNPFQSILVRMVETVYACEEALRLAESYDEPVRSAVPLEPHAGTGHGCSEAPRGVCYHRYRLDDDGRIVEAVIVPPTSQNQRQIEADLRRVVESNLDLSDAALKARCEQTIRNYDPCISCATHILELRIERD